VAGFYEDVNKSSDSELVLNLMTNFSIRIIFELVCLYFPNLLFVSRGRYQISDSSVVGWPLKLKASRNFCSACHGLWFLTRKRTDSSGGLLAFLHKTGWNPTPFFFYSKLLFNIQHFNNQLTHTTLKNVELLKHFKISKTAPTCLGLQGNHHQGATIST